MPKVLVTGASGQLASEIEVLVGDNSDFIFTSRKELDLSNTQSITRYFEENSFDVIVNCAAYTAVDKAESDQDNAYLINHKAVETLAEIAKDKKIKLIHVSTDYVFDGKHFEPYTEEDKTAPQSVYGESKLLGERAMIETNPKDSIIIRTSWVYSSFGANFVKTMLRLGDERAELNVIADQIGTPTYARDLAQAILEIIPQLKNEKIKIYHYSNEGVCSWYDFAKAIFEMLDINCNVKAIETKEYPTPAKRPSYSLLNKKKIKKGYNIEINYWRDSLKKCLITLKDNN